MSHSEIIIQSSVNAKQSKDFKKITHKAVAGLSEAELIERNTIGKLKECAKGADCEECDDRKCDATT